MNVMQPTGKLFVYLILAFSALLLLQLWGDVITVHAMGRLLLTFVILMVALALIAVVNRDFGQKPPRAPDA
jgi:hypothetical protein